MSEQMDEQARELFYELKPECQAHADGCKGCAEAIASIAALLAKARLEEVLNAPCPADCHSNFGLGTLPCDCWKAERIASLRQAAGEEPKP